jgi:hypothetical protein
VRTVETLWDDNALKATVAIVTRWIQARRGQSTCLCSRIQLKRPPILASRRTAAAPSGPAVFKTRWSTDEH